MINLEANAFHSFLIHLSIKFEENPLRFKTALNDESPMNYSDEIF